MLSEETTMKTFATGQESEHWENIQFSLSLDKFISVSSQAETLAVLCATSCGKVSKAHAT